MTGRVATGVCEGLQGGGAVLADTAGKKSDVAPLPAAAELPRKLSSASGRERFLKLKRSNTAAATLSKGGSAADTTPPSVEGPVLKDRLPPASFASFRARASMRADASPACLANSPVSCVCRARFSARVPPPATPSAAAPAAGSCPGTCTLNSSCVSGCSLPSAMPWATAGSNRGPTKSSSPAASAGQW